MVSPYAWNAGEWMLALVLFLIVVALAKRFVDALETWWRKRHPRPCELCQRYPARPDDCLCWSCVAEFRAVLRRPS